MKSLKVVKGKKFGKIHYRTQGVSYLYRYKNYV